MDLVRVESRDNLLELLKLQKVSANSVILVNISDIIKSEMVPERFDVYNYKVIIPTPTILNIYFSKGLTEDYRQEYLTHLSKPDVLFFINEVIYYAWAYNRDLIFFCADDEKEFEYMRILGEFIESLYGISMISYKKYKKDKKHSECTKSIADVLEECKERRDDLVRKLDALDISLPETLNKRITWTSIKNLPKKFKKKFEKFITTKKKKE